MDPKILLLVVVGIFAVAPQFTEAATPAFCKDLPVLVFPDESTVEKWAYNPKQNKCVTFAWNRDTKVRNSFDTQTECLRTCRPESGPTRPWILVNGRCLCRCPKCESNETTVKDKSNVTPKPRFPELTTTTTETSLLRSFFRN